jgi:hypothetical protein
MLFDIFRASAQGRRRTSGRPVTRVVRMVSDRVGPATEDALDLEGDGVAPGIGPQGRNPAGRIVDFVVVATAPSGARVQPLGGAAVALLDTAPAMRYPFSSKSHMRQGGEGVREYAHPLPAPQ